MNTDPGGHSRSSTRFRRVVTGLAILGAFLPLVWADAVGAAGALPGWWLLPVALVLAAGASVEAGAILARSVAPPRRGILVAGAVALPLAAALGSPPFREAGATGSPLFAPGLVAVTLAGAAVVAMLREIADYRSDAGASRRLAATILGICFVGLPMAFVVALRLVGAAPDGGAGAAPGLAPLVSLIAVVKSGDVAAYLVGSSVGKTRMAPALSPGKTWEGAAGACAGALAAAALVFGPLRGALAAPGGAAVEPLGGWALYGLALGAAGMMGDLAESLLKRDAGIKDSGTTLGALGGMLDLVDSLLVAAPVAWILWALAPPVGGPLAPGP